MDPFFDSRLIRPRRALIPAVGWVTRNKRPRGQHIAIMTRREMTKTACLLLSGALLLAAKDPVDAVNRGKDGLALKGYDAVAYFKESNAVKGNPSFQHSWMGATWQFSSAANLAEFQANPAKYAPQFGGYCAWAVSKNYTADADPQAWKIVDGKLYVNYNKDVQKMWEKDMGERIRSAESNWPKLHK